MAKTIEVLASEYSKRRDFIVKRHLNETEGMLISASSNVLRNGLDNVFPHRQDSNFYYLTGIREEDAVLLMYKNSSGKSHEMLFVQDKDAMKEKWTGYRLGAEEASRISGVEDVRPLSAFEGWGASLLNGMSALYVNYNYARSIGDSAISETSCAGRILKSHPHLNIKNALDVLRVMRTKKSPVEVKFLKEAIKITKAGLYKAWKRMKPGMREYELRAILEYEFRKSGGDIAFNSIVASGPNGVVLHYVSCDRVIEDGELVLFDVGAEYGLYSADITRTVPVNGRFSPRQRDIYDLVLKANKTTIAEARAGRDLSWLNREVTSKVLSEGLTGLGLIKDSSELNRYYYHGVSHHLGLDTHDLSDNHLKGAAVNSVITIEPGIYIKEENIGIRIEDDILVKREGSVNLSKSIIKEVSDIEHLLN